MPRAARIARIAGRVMGRSLLLMLVVVVVLYSSSASFVGYTLIRTAYLYQDYVRPPDGLGIVNVYSGTAITPITGLIPSRILAEAVKVKGVVTAWGEVTTPCLANGTLVVVRGLHQKYYEYAGIRLVSGDFPSERDFTGALVGAGLAKRLGLKPGDKLIVDSYFTSTPLILRVQGVIDGPPPYKWEILVNIDTGKALRGINGYSVARIVYEPGSLDKEALQAILGVNVKGNFLLNQVVLLVGKGWETTVNAKILQEYYLARLGVPVGVLAAIALLSDTLLSLLMIPLAWTIISLREREFHILIDEGLSPARIKLDVGLVTLPAVLAGVILGLIVPILAPPVLIMGYPVAYSLDAGFSIAHVAVLTALYGVGIATARIEE
ncbi:MAG: hypothetical protein GSR74_00860 [Desulfurococcales archaeon]|nr:hypothetical protein [Desulfurococcales archaeon]